MTSTSWWSRQPNALQISRQSTLCAYAKIEERRCHGNKLFAYTGLRQHAFVVWQDKAQPQVKQVGRLILFAVGQCVLIAMVYYSSLFWWQCSECWSKRMWNTSLMLKRKMCSRKAHVQWYNGVKKNSCCLPDQHGIANLPQTNSWQTNTHTGVPHQQILKNPSVASRLLQWLLQILGKTR